MHFKVLIFLSSLLFLVGCSAGPDFERDNENDPDGGSFIPNPPSGEHYELDEEGNVTLFWEDNTDFELGYRIYKSLGENESFKLLAELEENSTSYTDKSKLFAFPTRYHIVSYSEESESYAFTVEIDFGDISNFKAEFEKDYDSVNFSWQNEIYFVKVDGFLLSKKTDKESRFEPVEVIPNSVSEYSIPTPQDGFVHEFKLSAFNIYKSDTTLFASKAIPTISTEPKNLKLELISTDSLMITWKSISDFEDSFQLTLIDQSGKETVFLDEGTTSHTFAKQFVVDDELEVRLAGRNNSVLSPIVTKTLDTTLEPPILEQVQHLSDNELVISISDPSHISRDININRRTENSEFQMIGTAKRGNNTFLDNSADPTKTYTYNASTALSVNSDPIHVHYNKSFKQIKRITGAADLNVVAFEVGFPAYRQGSSKILFPSSYNRLEAVYFDIFTEKNIMKFDLAIFPKKISFDINETKIYTTNYQNSTIHIYDFESGAIIDSLKVEYSDIIDFELINADKIAASVRSDKDNYHLITINFTTQAVEIIDSFSQVSPRLKIDEMGKKLLLINSQSGSPYSYDHYTITDDGELIFNKRDVHSFYTTKFTSDLDTAIVIKQNDLSLFDTNTGERLWHFVHHSIRNFCCGNYQVQLLSEKLIVLQSQYCTYLIDMKSNENPIIDGRCYYSSSGVVNMNFDNINYILDLRRGNTTDDENFIDVLTIKEGWKEIF